MKVLETLHKRVQQQQQQHRRHQGESNNNGEAKDDHNTVLPSVSDRRATLGCLAGVLNLARNHPSSNSNNKSEGGVTLCRTKDVPRELLGLASECLGLDDGQEQEFVPLLENDHHSSHIVDEASMREAERRLLDPFVSSLSSAQAGFECISLLLVRFLLMGHSSSSNSEHNDPKRTPAKATKSSATKPTTILGYDARVRYAFKYTAVAILHFLDPVYGNFSTSGDNDDGSLSSSGGNLHFCLGRKAATARFEALEEALALRLARVTQHVVASEGTAAQASSPPDAMPHRPEIRKKNKVVRGLKIGGAAVGAGAVLALTGGIAAPFLVTGVAAAAGVTALSLGTWAVASLVVIPAAATVFGVGGSLLVARKMDRRTVGLTDFAIISAAAAPATKASLAGQAKDAAAEPPSSPPSQPLPKLSRTICINGWIGDSHDYQRPFGLPSNAPMSRSELLKRYCSVYAPGVMPSCDDILDEWKGSEDELWGMLQDAYGRDPDALYPIEHPSAATAARLTEDETDSLDAILAGVLGIEAERLRVVLDEDTKSSTKNSSSSSHDTSSLPLHPVRLLDDVLSASKAKGTENPTEEDHKKYRLYRAWDFQSTYRGTEAYSVSWERDLLVRLRGSVNDWQKDLAVAGAEKLLKKTALATLLSAVAVPSALLGLASLIDEDWTLANERADEAGILLAESLLESTAGHRPVQLVGVSFGARVIVSCLAELARHQAKWEAEAFPHRSSRDSLHKLITSGVTKLGGSASKNKAAKPSYMREPASIVENVVLMGCPASVKAPRWKSMRSVVAGRLVNCYAGNDLMLALMYRIKNPTTALFHPPVGITSVKEDGVTNYDVSDLLQTKHGEYGLVVREILDRIGFDQPPCQRAPPMTPNRRSGRSSAILEPGDSLQTLVGNSRTKKDSDRNRKQR